MVHCNELRRQILMDDGIDLHMIVWVEANVSKEDVFNDYRMSSQCGCAHDCCGCWFGGIQEIEMAVYNGENTYKCEVHYSRNY